MSGLLAPPPWTAEPWFVDALIGVAAAAAAVGITVLATVVRHRERLSEETPVTTVAVCMSALALAGFVTITLVLLWHRQPVLPGRQL